MFFTPPPPAPNHNLETTTGLNMSISTLGERLQSMNTPSAILPQLGRPFWVYIAGSMFEVFLYGINVALVSTALYILVCKSRGPSKYQLLISAVMMLTISTINVSLSMYSVFGLLIRGSSIPPSLLQTWHMLQLFNNVIADALLISRCYSVWSRSIRVIVFPSLVLLASSIIGVITTSPLGAELKSRRYIYLWLTLALNLCVTTLTAGRVLWIAHQAKKIIGPSLARKYYSVVAIIIESGAIYSSYVLLNQTPIPFGFVLASGLTQVVVVSPALIIVQIGLGRQIRDLDSTVQLNQETSMVPPIAQSEAATEYRTTSCH